MQRDAPTMHNNDKDFRMFSLIREGNEKSGTCGRSFSSFFFFFSAIFSAKDREINVIVSIGGCQTITALYLLHDGGKFVVGVGVGLLLQDLLSARCGSTLRKVRSVVGGAETTSGSVGLGHLLWLQLEPVFLDSVCRGIR